MSRRHLAHLFGTVVALVLIPSVLSAQSTKTERFDFPPGGVLRLENTTGELTVEGWDRTDVEITTIQSKDVAQVTALTRGNELVVRTDFPRYAVFPPPLPFRGAKEFDLEYRISAPKNASVVVDHDTGEVHIDNLAGDVQVKVLKGGMTLRLPETNSYAIDAKVDTGSIYSDFPGQWHRRLWPLGSRYGQATSATAHKLYLRAGFGDIAILKIRKSPWGYQP